MSKTQLLNKALEESGLEIRFFYKDMGVVGTEKFNNRFILLKRKFTKPDAPNAGYRFGIWHEENDIVTCHGIWELPLEYDVSFVVEVCKKYLIDQCSISELDNIQNAASPRISFEQFVAKSSR